MNFKYFYFLFLSLFILSCNQEKKSPLEELKLIGANMNSSKSIEYSFIIEKYRSYSGQGPSRKGKMLFVKNVKDTIIGMNFYYSQEPYDIFYNGVYKVTLNKSDSTAFKTKLNKSDGKHVNSFPGLEMSYCAVQLFLTNPHLESQIDSLIRRDTIIDNQACSYFSFSANEKFIDTHKTFDKYSKKIELIFRKSNLVPIYYSQNKRIPRRNSYDYIFTEAFFSNYSFKNKYSTSKFKMEAIPEYYTWDMYKNRHKVIAVGQSAPNWTLPRVSGDSLTLSNLRGKFVLLDFWFVGCGACVMSIPTLNEIQEIYKRNELEVIGINTDKINVEIIANYCSRRDMNYKNVWNSNSISEEYNVHAAPTFILIDKQGEIVYTQIGHDSEKLKGNIAKHLNKTPPNKS